MEYEKDDRRAVEESARRGDYLAGGHTVETHIAMLTRDMGVLITRVREGEERIKELETAKPSPEIVEMLEAYKRQQWIVKRVGMFFLAGPALLAVWQALTKLVEWMRGQ